jgi:hypothetical protein
MSATVEHLRTLPRKDEWTADEALALYEDVDGVPCVQGLPVPSFVQSREDRVRWANCVRVAMRTTGENGTPLIAEVARVMFDDRESYA